LPVRIEKAAFSIERVHRRGQAKHFCGVLLRTCVTNGGDVTGKAPADGGSAMLARLRTSCGERGRQDGTRLHPRPRPRKETWHDNVSVVAIA